MQPPENRPPNEKLENLQVADTRQQPTAMSDKRTVEAEREGETSENIPAQPAKQAETTSEERERKASPESPPPHERGTRDGSLEPPRTPSRAITPRLMTDQAREDDAEAVQSSQPKDKTL